MNREFGPRETVADVKSAHNQVLTAIIAAGHSSWGLARLFINILRKSRSQSLHINLSPLQMRAAKTPCSSTFRYCPSFNAMILLIVSAKAL
jgi:hypothetical protein